LRGAQAPRAHRALPCFIKNNSDSNWMKSRSAFEFTVRKMLRHDAKLYFWTFTFREVHSLKTAMGLWNQFLTLLKRKLNFRGVRVLELHEEHGCHFHVITDKRFKTRPVLAIGDRYGFGRTHVEESPMLPGDRLPVPILVQAARPMSKESAPFGLHLGRSCERVWLTSWLIPHSSEFCARSWAVRLLTNFSIRRLRRQLLGAVGTNGPFLRLSHSVGKIPIRFRRELSETTRTLGFSSFLRDLSVIGALVRGDAGL